MPIISNMEVEVKKSGGVKIFTVLISKNKEVRDKKLVLKEDYDKLMRDYINLKISIEPVKVDMPVSGSSEDLDAIINDEMSNDE